MICPVISWEVIHNSYMYKLIERLGNVQAISISLHIFFTSYYQIDNILFYTGISRVGGVHS